MTMARLTIMDKRETRHEVFDVKRRGKAENVRSTVLISVDEACRFDVQFSAQQPYLHTGGTRP
jgi:hypothetical protein